MTLIIHAPNAHQGGGRTLLLSVLEVAGNLPCIAILDDRLELPPQSPTSLTVLRVRPTLAGRFIGEWRLRCVCPCVSPRPNSAGLSRRILRKP